MQIDDDATNNVEDQNNTKKSFFSNNNKPQQAQSNNTTPPLIMNIITGHYRRNNDDDTNIITSQNNVNEVEEMETTTPQEVTAMETEVMDGHIQNGDDIIGPQPDPNNSGVVVRDADMEEDEARSEATFRYTVQQFSKLRVCVLYLQVNPAFIQC